MFQSHRPGKRQYWTRYLSESCAVVVTIIQPPARSHGFAQRTGGTLQKFAQGTVQTKGGGLRPMSAEELEEKLVVAKPFSHRRRCVRLWGASRPLCYRTVVEYRKVWFALRKRTQSWDTPCNLIALFLEHEHYIVAGWMTDGGTSSNWRFDRNSRHP